MGSTVKLANDLYLETSSIVHNKEINLETYLNNLETLINEGTVYSTKERVIGKWLDGKPIYRKVINWGALPDNNASLKPHNISNIDNIIKVFGWSYRQSDNTFLPLPHVAFNNTAVTLYASKTGITIVTYTSRSAFSKTYVVLEYTKTTD